MEEGSWSPVEALDWGPARTGKKRNACPVAEAKDIGWPAPSQVAVLGFRAACCAPNLGLAKQHRKDWSLADPSSGSTVTRQAWLPFYREDIR